MPSKAVVFVVVSTPSRMLEPEGKDLALKAALVTVFFIYKYYFNELMESQKRFATLIASIAALPVTITTSLPIASLYATNPSHVGADDKKEACLFSNNCPGGGNSAHITYPGTGAGNCLSSPFDLNGACSQHSIDNTVQLCEKNTPNAQGNQPANCTYDPGHK